MSSAKTTKTKWRYKYFGYIIRQEWLLAYGVHNDLCPDLNPATRHPKDVPVEEVDEVGSIISAALLNVIGRAKLTFASTIGSVMHDGIPEYCIVLSTNDPRDNLPFPPPEKYAKLKEILGTTKEPHWYPAE